MCIESIERYRHKVSAEGGHTRHEIGVDSRMKWLSFVALLSAVFASGVRAQWVAPQHDLLNPGEFDRPRPAHHRAEIRPLSVPPSIPNWPFPNIDVTNSNVEQDEPMVAINPMDSLNIIIGANDDRDSRTLWAYASTDGGQSWANTALPIPFQWMLAGEATDPSIAFTPVGDALFANGHSDGAPFDSPNDVSCFQSSNGGLDWSMLSDVFQDSSGVKDTSSDKFFIATDGNSGSPFFGRTYVTWVDQRDEEGYVRIVSSYSTDDGRTWSERRYLTGLGHYTSPVPVSEPDGTLLVSFVNYYPNHSILLARSSNGGVSFDAPQAIASYKNLGPLLPKDSLGYPNIGPPDSALGVNSFPSIATDGSALHAGRAYLVWCGKGNDDLPHVWFTTSDDDGVSWKAPRSIEGDSVARPSSRFFPWVAVDPSTGNVGIDYYAARMDTVPPKRSEGNLLLQADLYMLHSTDGGASFAARRISSASFDPISGQDERTPESTDIWFFGDYIGIAGRSNTWYPTWTDGRSGDAEIYTSIVQPFAPMPVTQLASHDTTVNGKPAAVLTWQYTPETTFGYPLPAGYEFDVAKDGSRVSLQPGDILQFVDTNIQKGNEYEVTVVSGRYRSITDSVANAKNAVALQVPNVSSIRFTNEPAVAGREDQLFLDCGEACRVSIAFYDALGRELSSAMSDGIVAAHHQLEFTPEEPGVQFFVIKEISATSSREITGKISVLR